MGKRIHIRQDVIRAVRDVLYPAWRDEDIVRVLTAEMYGPRLPHGKPGTFSAFDRRTQIRAQAAADRAGREG